LDEIAAAYNQASGANRAQVESVGLSGVTLKPAVFEPGRLVPPPKEHA
jgi:hypothetical protein